MNARTPPVRVSAAQYCCGADLDTNFRQVDELLAAAAARDCRLVLLPENAFFMGAADEDKLAIAESEGSGAIQEFLAGAASRHGLWVIAGSVPLKSDDPAKCYGATLVYDDAGEQQAVYRKMHLFDVDLPESGEHYRESDTMARGTRLCVTDSPAGRLGLSICYDLRFPELYRRLVELGATIVCVPAAFTFTTGRAHWRSLLRARAIENQVWVIAAGQVGEHPNGRRTYGHSMIVDPWGRVIDELPDGIGLVEADIDLTAQRALRTRFPVLQHRQLPTG